MRRIPAKSRSPTRQLAMIKANGSAIIPKIVTLGGAVKVADL
jgi:hypothetical protein